MLVVPTTLLLHRTTEETHHDWLVGTPDHHRDAGSRLWAARVRPASGDWRGLGCFDLDVIAPHRRTYLDYQGPVAGNRGYVTRADRGTATIRLWSRDRIVWDVRMRGFIGTIGARRLTETLWRAAVVF
jgi:hypothetical protein